jgi:hypothetical protein
MPSSRKSGAQPHNKNALKHGIYSQFILLRDDADMKGMSSGDLKDELYMARVNFIASMHKRALAEDLKDWLSADFSAHYWFESIVNLKSKAMERQEAAATVWDDFMEAMREANDKQNVR